MGKALGEAFTRVFPDGYAEDEGDAGTSAPVYAALLGWVRSGGTLDLDDTAGDAEHLARLGEVTGLRELVERTASPASDGERAALMELVLEGLQQQKW